MRSIQVAQQLGQIGLHIVRPDLELSIKQPEAVITTTPPDLELTVTSPEVIIDLRESFNSMGLGDINYVMAQFVADAKRTVASGIARRVAEGKELADPHGPSIGAVAAAAAKPPEKKLVIGLAPAVPPHITARMGEVKGLYRPGQVTVELSRGEVHGRFTWGRVEVYLVREPYVDVKV